MLFKKFSGITSGRDATIVYSLIRSFLDVKYIIITLYEVMNAKYDHGSNDIPGYKYVKGEYDEQINNANPTNANPTYNELAENLASILMIPKTQKQVFKLEDGFLRLNGYNRSYDGGQIVTIDNSYQNRYNYNYKKMLEQFGKPVEPVKGWGNTLRGYFKKAQAPIVKGGYTKRRNKFYSKRNSSKIKLKTSRRRK